MTVYVDDMRAKYRRMLMSHMLADSDEELHSMADKIGVARKWHQKPPKASTSHYDVCQNKKALALQHGAKAVTQRQMAAMNMRRRLTGELGTPETALAWFRNERKNNKVDKSFNNN